MTFTETSWSSKDNLNYYARHWKADNSKAVIALVHGFYEHVGRYAHVAEYFVKHGFSVVAYDQRGHGKSEGPRGHTPTYEMLMHDVDFLLDNVERLEGGKPVFLYGHSFGGNVVVNYTLARKPQIAGSILTGPWFRLAFEPPKAKVTMARIMNNIYGAYSEKTQIALDHLSRDKSVGEAYDADPLVHNEMSARMFTSILQAGDWALRHAANLEIPMLLMHGEEDKVTSSVASQEFASNAPADKLTLKLWNGLYHEIHNEPEQEMILEYAVEWLKGKI